MNEDPLLALAPVVRVCEALLRARIEDLPGSPVPIRFASPEDVVLAKMKWYRDGGERSERQWGDLLGILRVQGGALDEAYMDRWLDELGGPGPS